MKNLLCVIALLLVIVMITVFFAACGTQEGYKKNGEFITNENPIALVVILGRHANAMAIPDDAYRAVETALGKAVYGGYACAIVSDGKPTKIDLVDRDFFAENARNDTILNREINNRVEKLGNAIRDESITANDTENDLLAAIREAQNALSATDIKGISDKHIIIVDTGITTTGDLNFFGLNLLQNRPKADDVVAQFRNAGGIDILPDLTGIKVTFVGTADGMAEVSSFQPLGTADKKYIRDFWTSFVEACGASNVNYESAAGWNKPNVYTGESDSDFPYVSIVPFEYKPIVTIEIPERDPNNPDVQPTLPPPVIDVRLGEEKVGFVPDSSEFISLSNTKETLRPYASDIIKFLESFPNEKIWLVGTTAVKRDNRGGEGSISLGLQRAGAVKEMLVKEFGVSEDSLVTIGLGARFPWHRDEFPNGDYDTETAQFNRSVWLMTDNGDSERFNMLRKSDGNGELLPEASTRLKELIGNE